MVIRIDRLARSSRRPAGDRSHAPARGAILKAIEQPRHGHGSRQGLTGHARRVRGLRYNLRRERQLEVHRQGKAAGVYKVVREE
jgi:hypothetical protein